MSFMVECNRLIFPEPVSSGMNIYRLATLADMYRTTNEHTTPILIRTHYPAVGENYYYTITDGRHRVVASMMAGRKTILAELDE